MLRRSALLRAVDFKDFTCSRLVTLNREKALNAVNTAMMEEMLKVYKTAPHADPDAVYILKGAGTKAFCAGGDVVSVVKDSPPGTQQEFFYKEYQVNYHILTMPRTQVALWNGIVMGGGVGVSIHGKYRVASERALFAMPETGIGLFPDVGGSWFLPRLPSKSVGLYLSLAGQRLKGADLKHAGLATHYVTSDQLPKLEEALCNVKGSSDVPAILDDFASKTPLPAYSLSSDLGWMIEKIFDPAVTVEEIVQRLQSEGTEIGTKMANDILKCCPVALKVSRELFRRGGEITDPKNIFKMEYIATQRAMAHGDFARGVTALLIDKTGNAKWDPATLEGVSDELVQSHFKPFSPQTKVWDPETSFEDAKPAAQ
jgi:3-hydroxyisobutyryl-CoA hydrolase